jgi:hypothetical protein
MNTETITETEQVIYDMLTENTGTHFLDSGGELNRHWQKNAQKTLEEFRNEPRETIDRDWGDVSKSVFHYLMENLKFAGGLNLDFEEFAKGYPEESWLEVMSLWLDSLGVENEGEFYSDARWQFNTYNFYGCLLSQTLQGYIFGLGTAEYVILQIHGGADVRGGYSKPRVFKVSYKEDFVLNTETASFVCKNLECDNRLEVRSDSREIETDSETIWLNDSREGLVCPCGSAWDF